MQRILEDINGVLGVTGCFVCDGDGRVLASALPDVFDEVILTTVGRTITQTTAGLFVTRRRKVRDIDLLYAEGRVVVKPLREGCLCILCVRDINVPLLNLTANLAARRLAAEMTRRRAPTVDVQPEEPSIEPLLAQIVGAYPDLVALVMEFDRSLEGDQRDSILMTLGQRSGAVLFGQRYASMSIPPSMAQGLELVVVPAVAPFAIANAEGNRLDVLACPFCRNLLSSLPRCHFLAGFIQGLLSSIPSLGEPVVTETLCRARGDDTCTFEVAKKEA